MVMEDKVVMMRMMRKVKKVEKVEKGEKGKGGCTCIMNVAASKVSFGMHNMPANEFGERSALKF